MSHIGTYRIGATMSIALDLLSGSVDDVVSANAAIRRVRKGTNDRVEFAAQESAIPMTVALRDAAGDIPAGWNLGLSAAASGGLQPGFYGIDVKFVLVNATTITERSGIVEFTRGAV